MNVNDMKTYFLLFFFYCLILLNSCALTEKKSDKIFYFYDAKKIFEVYDVNVDSLHYLSYEKVLEFPNELTAICNNKKTYILKHYYKFRNLRRDTTFIKHKSYLDSLSYYGSEWFSKEQNLDKLWESAKPGKIDSLVIYVIEPLQGKDSVLFSQSLRTG